MEEPATGQEQGGTSVLEAQLSGTAVATITFTNRGTATANSSSANFAGFLTPAPASSVNAGQSDHYTETGIGNTSSFHIDYTAGSKKCHFDSASFSDGGTLITPPACKFTKNAQSQGSTFATCTATLTAFDLMTCSQSLTFSMQ
jgi:hypothetical protein